MNKNQRTTTNIKLNNTNIEILKNNFPQCFDKNGDFQIEKFQNELKDNEINFSKESYGIDWLGKSYSRLLASDEATTLLKEDKEFNQKPENINSENLLIKGDNLEVLKHLVGAYYEKIKMIYIDPPYNTGTDGFVYNDDRKFTVNQLKELAGIDEDKAKRILEFIQSNSNSHSAWLTFMYPRLYIAKQLLKDDGVIFISIDDNEVAQLRLIMDEIFGEENFIALAPRKTGAGSAATRSDSELRKLNDFVFIYQKVKLEFQQKIMGEKSFPYKDEIGIYYLAQFQASGSDAKRSDRPNMYYPIYVTDNDQLSTIPTLLYKKIITPEKVKGEDGRWLWRPEKFEKDKHLLHYENGKISRKIYFNEINDNTIYQVEKAWFENYSNASGTKYLNLLFSPLKDVFSNPKPIDLIIHLIKLLKNSIEEEDIILDFFAGSGTTGDAVMQLNKEDGGNRKFILVQLPEEIDKVKNKVAYDFVKNELGVETPTIFEITKERLIRAAKRLKEDGYKGDLGFKIFETMPIWEDYNFEADELNKELNLFDDEKLTADDINALLTTWKTYDGVSLTKNLEEIDLGGYLSYYGNGKLYLMSEGFNTDNLKFMLEKIDNDKNFNPTSIIVFGYKFESKNLREIAENIKAYSNKKNIDIDFITRY
ncbi:MAG: site-specific DNA-methyltransferase [Sphaerochaetaceae bacterium]